MLSNAKRAAFSQPPIDCAAVPTDSLTVATGDPTLQGGAAARPLTRTHNAETWAFHRLAIDNVVVRAAPPAAVSVRRRRIFRIVMVWFLPDHMLAVRYLVHNRW